MDHQVIHRPETLKELERFVAVRVDCTESGGAGEKLLKQYGFPGLPSYAFYDTQGHPMKDLGFSGPKPLAEFLELLRSVR